MISYWPTIVQLKVYWPVIGILVYVLAFHWSFVLFDVVFIRYYKLLQKCLQKKGGEIANFRGWIKGSPSTPSLTRADTPPVNIPKTAKNQNPAPLLVV